MLPEHQHFDKWTLRPPLPKRRYRPLAAILDLLSVSIPVGLALSMFGPKIGVATAITLLLAGLWGKPPAPPVQVCKDDSCSASPRSTPTTLKDYGLEYDPATGVLSGTPTKEGTLEFVFKDNVIADVTTKNIDIRNNIWYSSEGRQPGELLIRNNFITRLLPERKPDIVKK